MNSVSRSGLPRTVATMLDDPVVDFPAAREGGVSSKFEIAVREADWLAYPPTERPSDDPAPPWPCHEIGQTQPNRPGAGKVPSDPEIVWNLKEAMREMPKVGDDFLGFSLLAELGKGAFGKVFLAQQTDLAGRFVALKVAAGLFNESQTLAQLQHTHIVPIYSYHHAPAFQAVCMPYLGATTLAHILADIRTHKEMPSSGRDLLSTLGGRKKSTRHLDESSKTSGVVNDVALEPGDLLPARMPVGVLEIEGMTYVDSILWLAARLADGLAHAHERGILHRDLKPANVLLTDDGVPMLLDFNLAQDTKERGNAAAAAIGGTLPYMAPEHLEAFQGVATTVDQRSDLYSLGIILFELLTGAAPYASYRKLPVRDVVERMIGDRKQGTPGLRSLNPSIPPAVEAIVLKCLAADPEHRYQTARQLQEDLKRQLDHEPLKHAPNPSLRERCQKFRRRHPRLTSVSAVACVALFMIAGLAAALVYRGEQHATLKARAKFERFHDDALKTSFLLDAHTAKHQLKKGKKAAVQALKHFDVLDNPNWLSSADVQRLSTSQRWHLQQDASQLLLLLASAQQLASEREKDAQQRDALLREGLHYCSLAENCLPEERMPQALWKQKGSLLERLNEQAKAAENFERARQLGMRTPHDRYLAARQLAEDGKYRAALPLVREAIRMRPQEYNFHFLEGICHDRLGQHAEAIACYRGCIALRPGFFGAFYNRGLVYLRIGNWNAARADFDQTLSLRHTHVEALIQRALAHEGMRDYQAAIDDLSDALSAGCAETRVFFLRAKLRDKAGDARGAKADRAEGLRREPADELSWIARGLAQLPADPKRALSDFDQALVLNPHSLAGLTNKAHVLAKYFKRTAEAVQVLDKAVALFPDDVRPLAGRGVYLARLGKRDAALKDAGKALLTDTQPANLYQVAGIYALTSKQEPDDQREALRLLSAALKKGFGFDYLEIDRDLDPLRISPTFRRVIEAARAMRNTK